MKARKECENESLAIFSSNLSVYGGVAEKPVRFHQEEREESKLFLPKKLTSTPPIMAPQPLPPNPDEGLAGCPGQTSAAQGEPRR